MFKGILIVLLGAVINTLAYNDDAIDLSYFGPKLFGQPIETVGKDWYNGHGNAEEQGPYLEGDLLIPSTTRNGMKSESLRWKKGEVPFEIRGGYSELSFL